MLFIDKFKLAETEPTILTETVAHRTNITEQALKKRKLNHSAYIDTFVERLFSVKKRKLQ